MAEVAIAVDWSDMVGTPIAHVNQFVAQPGPPTMEGNPDGIYLALGSVPPPFIPADPEGQRQAIAHLKNSGLKATLHGRFHMSRERLEELILVLQRTAEIYDSVSSKSQVRTGAEDEEKSP